MKKLLILSTMLFSFFIYSQEYNFNIPLENKDHEVIKFSAEQGKTYNWDRCFGQTTQVLSEDGVACEKVYNAKEGFTGSVDVCVTSTKDYLSDPYCFAMCQGETVSWNNCTANVGLSEHLEIKEITNTDNRYVGTAELLCTDGAWSIKSSNCEDNLAVCGTDNNTTNNSPSNLCEIGQASSVTSNQNTMNWTCTTTASNASCSSYKVAVCDTNTFNGCSVGTSGGYTSNISDTTATWTCSNGGSNVNCTKPKLAGTNGVCGSSNGQTVSTAPSSNLCSSGTATSIITGTNNFTWSCNGSMATNTNVIGSNSNCSAIKYNCNYNEQFKITREYDDGDVYIKHYNNSSEHSYELRFYRGTYNGVNDGGENWYYKSGSSSGNMGKLMDTTIYDSSNYIEYFELCW